MSSDRPPEFFFDRNLGKTSARLLREHGWTVHLIADFYPDDASDVGDEEWIFEGCRRGWILLTKDKKIRYRTKELAALRDGHLFCLASGNLDLQEMAQRFIAAGPAILRASHTTDVGFWHVYEGGRIRKMWP
jgi:hypothetical protein